MPYIAICEDDSFQIDIIKSLLIKYQIERPGLEIKWRCFDSGDQLFKSLSAGDTYELFLLDILLPGINGIEIASELRKKDEDVPLIFLTSSQDYALKAFSVSASQYILKPVRVSNLFPVLDKVIPTINQKKERYFLLSMPERDVKIPFSSIVCVELVSRRLNVYLDDGRVLFSKCLRIPFVQAIEPLIKDDRFLNEHKSFIINIAHVEELASGSFVMKNNVIVPIPRYKYAEAKAKYLSYISKTH